MIDGVEVWFGGAAKTARAMTFPIAAKLVICLVALLLCTGLHAQITGGLRGTVSDPTGSGVPKATVTLTNLETRQARTQSTNSPGEFNFELLAIGTYEVRAEAAGFAASVAQADVRMASQNW